jgi:hypothetical protein
MVTTFQLSLENSNTPNTNNNIKIIPYPNPVLLTIYLYIDTKPNTMKIPQKIIKRKHFPPVYIKIHQVKYKEKDHKNRNNNKTNKKGKIKYT